MASSEVKVALATLAIYKKKQNVTFSFFRKKKQKLELRKQASMANKASTQRN